jgi:mono/diheme cytochrome c family protein
MSMHRRFAHAFAAGLVAVLVLGLSACGGSDDGTTSTPTSTEAAATGDPTAGKEVFTSTCGSCHTLADAGTSGAIGPNLDDLAPSEETVANQVRTGGGAMPAFGDELSAQQIADVAAYVSSVAGS